VTSERVSQIWIWMWMLHNQDECVRVESSCLSERNRERDRVFWRWALLRTMYESNKSELCCVGLRQHQQHQHGSFLSLFFFGSGSIPVSQRFFLLVFEFGSVAVSVSSLSLVLFLFLSFCLLLS